MASSFFVITPARSRFIPVASPCAAEKGMIGGNSICEVHRAIRESPKGQEDGLVAEGRDGQLCHVDVDVGNSWAALS